MHTLLIMINGFLSIYNVHANLLPNKWEMVSRIEKLNPSSARTWSPEQSIHEIYNPPAPHQFSSDRQSQKLLQLYDDDVREISHFSEGSIKMLSTAGHIVPIDFKLSNTVCSIGAETLRMIDELGVWLLLPHTAHIIEANETIQETVKVYTKRTEYRATLSLKIDGDMEAGPYLGLVKLLKKTAEVLFAEIGEWGFGTLVQKGEFENVGFEAFWTWYEFADGGVRRCENGKQIKGSIIKLI